MKSSIVLFMVLLSVVGPTVASGSDTGSSTLPLMRAPIPEEAWPLRAANSLQSVRSQDTTWYGDYEIIGGDYYARQASSRTDVMWTFDRGNGPFDDPERLYNGEGWKVVDETAGTVFYFRLIDNTLNLGQGVSAPIIAGTKSIWIGADKPQADGLCWDCGAGYGNDWCQRMVSETLPYNGSGSVTISFKYFNMTEPCYDGSQVYLKRADNTELLLNGAPSGSCPGNPVFENNGGFTDSIGDFSHPATYSRAVLQSEIGGAQNVRFVLEFKSDPGASDEDCTFPTIWGPFGVDDVTISGGGINRTYNFETDLQGWSPAFCNPVGAYVGIVDVGCYTILDPCQCRLSGNVLEMHADVCDNGVHPVGQHTRVESPICDFGSADLRTIFMEFDLYSEMPREDGVAVRPGWRYYPYTCDVTGEVGWSPRVGNKYFHFYGGDPLCVTWRYGGTSITDGGIPVPPDAEKVIAEIDVLASCASFAITNCTGVTNFTPIFDNIVVATTAPQVNAPAVSYDAGNQFADAGSYPSGLFDPRAPGQANTAADRYMDDPAKPDYSGDSLVVAGPQPGADPNKRWEARLWWRVARRAPLNSERANSQDTRYKIWRDRVADGKKIDRPYKPEFTFGWMDSAQTGAIALRNKFQSTFRENDDDFVGEGIAENEMIWDDALFPGSRIDYFVTTNYVGSPNVLFFLPDTAGGYFNEFEILPGLRTAYVPNCGLGSQCVFQPSTLYIRAFTERSQFFVENALRSILNGYPPCMEEVGCAIPPDRNWDRYDYLDASSNTNPPFARGTVAGSNNGMTLNQILGYQAILLQLGNYGAGTTEDSDYALYGQWLISPLCHSNENRQVFIANGDKVGEALAAWQPNGETFLNQTLGAILLCDAFNGLSNDPDCAPQEPAYCVRYLPIQGGPFTTEMDLDAYGSYCPNTYGFNVYSTAGTGVGNRYYSADGGGGKTAYYAQVANQNLGPDANWRTIVDGVSWSHLTRRDPSGSGESLCPRDVPSVVAGAVAEIGAELKWGFGVGNNAQIPKLASADVLAQCQGTGGYPADVGDGSGTVLVNRLFQNEPNPFNPRTTIRFALAQDGPVVVSIYDVGGRLVRTLVDQRMRPGTYSVVWDGTNDGGRKVGSGVYWSQMKAGSFVSNKKVVVLK